MLLCLLTLLSGCETMRQHYAAETEPVAGAASYRLTFRDQRLNELPALGAAAQRVRRVDLSGNPALDLERELAALCRLPKLRTLVLENMALTALPGSLRACRRLTHLSLAGNPELDLTEAAHVLRSVPVAYLNLARNELTTLPAELVTIKTLRDLRLSHNRIHTSESFETLAQLPALFSLWLDHNDLSQLPAAAGTMHQLRYLFLDHNKLVGIPALKPKGLLVLHLTHNRLDRLPEELLAMPRLLTVFAASNAIKTVDDAYFVQRRLNLRGVVLDGNCLAPEEEARLRRRFRHFFLYSADHQRTCTGEPTPTPSANPTVTQAGLSRLRGVRGSTGSHRLQLPAPAMQPVDPPGPQSG